MTLLSTCRRAAYAPAVVFLTLSAAQGASEVSPGWPTRPIRMIVPQPPGGSTDVIARVIAQRMSEALGHPVIYASSGFATSTHMAAELFMYMTGVSMVNITYKGGASAMVAMLAGECQINFATISTAMPHVHSNRLRALAVTSAKRSAAAPELPTIADSGIAGYDHASWIGLFAPARTPEPVIARLNAEAVKAARSKEVKAVFVSEGLEATGTTPDAFGALVKTEIAKWLKVARAAKLAAQ